MIAVSDGVGEFLLALADDEHLMGQQHTEWIGVTPFLEEDLAFSSIGQDELGHAALLYALLAGDDDPAIDRLAFDRTAAEYRSCWLVERASTDWAEALVRHWLYDSVEQIRWELLSSSSISELADTAARALSEERFHLRHANSLLDVLLLDNGARDRLLAALDVMLPLALGLFEGVAGEAEAVASGVATSPLADARPRWDEIVTGRFGIDPADHTGPAQQARTVRSDDFAPLLARMREVFEFDPAAVW